MLLGYSGGADSTCLLHLLATAGIDVVAAHLHHGQRPEADDEQKRCQEFAEELGVSFVTGNSDVPAIARDTGKGLEEAGRDARYAFFQQAARHAECDLIATAHTRNDLVESVILNIVRGSGLAGLAGIPERRGEIIRPILYATRDDTKRYCEERDLWFHNDPSNDDVNFSRARVRHRVFPELLKINPSADAAIARLADVAGEEDRFLNGMAAAALEQSERPMNGALEFLTRDVEIAFHRLHLEHLPAVLFKRAVRLAVEALGGHLDFNQTRLIVAGFVDDEKGSVTTEGGDVTLSWDDEKLHVRKAHPTQPFRYPLTLPGKTESAEFGWQFVAFEGAPNADPATRTNLSIQLDKSKVKGQLYFRTAQAGDEMQPLGFSGRRKLSDLISEAHLTQAARSRLPIVCDLVGPIWAPGVCLDERVRKVESTQTVIHIRFEEFTAEDLNPKG